MISLLKAIDLIAEKIAVESAEEELNMGEVNSYSGVICDLAKLSLNSLKSKSQDSYCEQQVPTNSQGAVENLHRSSSATFATSSYSTPIGPFFYPTASTIGDRIRTLREECEFSRMDLADTIDVPRSLMWKWEHNEICPDDDQLARLAKELGCDPHWLLTGDGRPVPAENNQAESTCKSETLGDRIKSMRELRNLGQFYLASSIGVTRSCVEAWEENTTVPSCDRLMPLANALNCDPMWLLTGEHSIRQASTDIGERQHPHASRPTDDLS